MICWFSLVVLNQPIEIVSNYASLQEQGQVRGKIAYLQYSNIHEIINCKNFGDDTNNVLLVKIEGVEAGDVTIDGIKLVSFRE